MCHTPLCISGFFPSDLTFNARWVKDAASRVLAAMEERRSTWQIWHVRAEAQRKSESRRTPSRAN
jgi:hypothetical protein